MAAERKLIFFLHHHNDLDQTAPLIDAVGRKTDILIDVIIDDVTTIGHFKNAIESDYRLKRINLIKTVSIYTTSEILGLIENSQQTIKRRSLNRLKDSKVLRTLANVVPADVPKRLFKTTVKQSTKERDQQILDVLCDSDQKVVVASDWTVAKNPSFAVLECAQEREYTTVVLPHGDSPYWNDVKKQSYFDQVVSNRDIYTDSSSWFVSTYDKYKRMAGNDWFLMPNKKTAKRLKPFVSSDKIDILGSPRFNRKWLSTLAKIRPSFSPSMSGDLNIVMFARNSRYFLSEPEVTNTIRLVTGFEDINLVFKEHPRKGRVLDMDGELSKRENLTIIRDEVSSAALVEWGDIFLEMGTSIVFEPIMREQPVLSLDYTHANYSTVSQYFSAADTRSKDDLYYSLYSLRDHGLTDFYDRSRRDTFIKEMITNGGSQVLDDYTSFFVSLFDD